MGQATVVMMIPSLWSSACSFLTPTVLFLLLNLVIATIALISSSKAAPAGPPADAKPPIARTPSLILDRLRSFNLHSYLPGTPAQPEEEPEPEPRPEEHHMSRSQSDTKPAGGEMPEKLPTKMEKSASNHFEFGEDGVRGQRRPKTARERVLVREEDVEVDSRADDFINRFKQQLRLQRLDSIIRYKEMLQRGGGGGGGD